LGAGSLIFMPLEDLPVTFLVFFWGVRVAVAFHLPIRVFDAPADGFPADLPHGDWAGTRITRMGVSPSNTGMGEIELSKAYIQTYKYKITRR
jgi:hypothetical protein